MPIAKKKDIPQDFLEQMQTNLKKNVQDVLEPEKTSDPVTAVNAPKNASVEPVRASFSAGAEKKEKYADVMYIRLSKGRRNEIKTFCTSCGISVTQYIESSFEFLAKEVASGNIVISKGGITKIGN